MYRGLCLSICGVLLVARFWMLALGAGIPYLTFAHSMNCERLLKEGLRVFDSGPSQLSAIGSYLPKLKLGMAAHCEY